MTLNVPTSTAAFDDCANDGLALASNPTNTSNPFGILPPASVQDVAIERSDVITRTSRAANVVVASERRELSSRQMSRFKLSNRDFAEDLHRA
jgi:hypothetical protein